jgi:hypothetical protein
VIGSRFRGKGCKKCADARVPRTQSIAARAPALAKLWHPTRNLPLLPREAGPKARRAYWWKCPRGADHEWQSRPWFVLKAKAPCPFCAGRRVSLTNCLAVTHTDVSLTWHPTRDAPLTPTDVLAGSRQPFWWTCAAAHAWRSSVRDQVRRAGICPRCGRTPR